MNDNVGMETPILILNLKNYEQALLNDGDRLLQACEKAIEQTGKKIAVTPPLLDLINVNHEKENVYVLSQHVDPYSYGSHTGSVLPEHLDRIGVDGTLLNHSERRLDPSVIRKTVERCNKVGLETIVCVQNHHEAERYSNWNPSYVAVEPPELIGGDVSISSAKPELVEKSVEKAHPVPVLCGAGVHERRDVEKGIELGAEGVLLAHAVVEAEDPVSVLVDMVEGF